MDILSITQACIRRWYVLAPLVVATALICFLVGRNSTPVFERTDSYLVITPSGSAEGGANPLSSSSNAIAALVDRLNAPDVAAEVASQVPDAAVGADRSSQGAIIYLTAQGSGGSAVSAALETYADVSDEVFATLQDQVRSPTATFFELVPLSTGATVASYPARNQAIGVAALAGLLASILLTELTDKLLHRRRQAATSAEPTEPSESPEAHVASADHSDVSEAFRPTGAHREVGSTTSRDDAATDDKSMTPGST